MGVCKRSITVLGVCEGKKFKGHKSEHYGHDRKDQSCNYSENRKKTMTKYKFDGTLIFSNQSIMNFVRFLIFGVTGFEKSAI